MYFNSVYFLFLFLVDIKIDPTEFEKLGKDGVGTAEVEVAKPAPTTKRTSPIKK